jgi:hypothetical protein
MQEINAADLIKASDAEVGDLILKHGAYVLRGAIDGPTIQALKDALIKALAEDDANHGLEYKFRGMVHALMSRGQPFLDLLGNPALRRACKTVLGHGCIVHAYNSSSMPPGTTNYSRTIHVDAPRLIPGYVTNMGVTIALDPFNLENGAMEIMPGSFKLPQAPAELDFQKNAEQPLLAPGDAILFNARCWHRGGVNRTPNWRHAVTMNICRSYIRQQFDYPRMLDNLHINGLDEDRRQFLGYYVRMPASMAEFLLPADQRPYRPGQE